MKKLLTAALAAALLALPAVALTQKAARNKTLEVSFRYERQQTHGSNQYAVWIENAEGKVVRTLFVTAYTTKGRTRGNEQPMRGYVKRPFCVPTWVKNVNAEALTDQQLDAFTGATPQTSGEQVFTWDFTDQSGKPVAKGKYRVRIEATLFDASIITYTGNFSTKDKAGDIAMTSEITEPSEERMNMVTQVRARLK